MMPGPLLEVPLEDIPGVGGNMFKRLMRIGIYDTPALYRMEPKHMRMVWNSVNGERLWYALHGYDIQAPVSKRGMFGHGRVLPPEARSIEGALQVTGVCRLSRCIHDFNGVAARGAHQSACYFEPYATRVARCRFRPSSSRSSRKSNPKVFSKRGVIQFGSGSKLIYRMDS